MGIRKATRATSKASHFPVAVAETLSGNKVLTAAELDRSQFFAIDPGGANRSITVLDAAGMKGFFHIIYNAANDTEIISLLDANAAVLARADQGEMILFWSDGSTVAAEVLSKNVIHSFEETFAFDDMTDGGGAAGTYTITTGNFPIGAIALAAVITALTGFAGDSSATVQVGDGSDVDRYNTGTPDVFSDAANGVALGDPSGTKYHAAAATPVVTITSGSDFGAVNAGEMTIKFLYILA